MKSKIILSILGLSLVFFFSGCSNRKIKSLEYMAPNEDSPLVEGKPIENKGYVGGMLDIKKQSEAKINSAINQENAKINEEMKNIK